MGKVSATILGAIIGGFAAATAIIFGFGWGVPSAGQAIHADPTRADYIDLLLTVATMFLGAVGLTVTIGALVIGLVALKTLREIKDDAANGAKEAAAGKINETMAAELAPNVDAKVRDVLPAALQTALMDNELGHKILAEMARRGELDAVLERVAMRIQNGGPEQTPASADHYADDEGEQA